MSPSWNDFESRRRHAPVRQDEPEADALDLSEMATLCRDVLGTEKGRRLLGLLRRRTKDAVLGPGASERALWFREGQRQLVDQLERATALGLTISTEQLRDELPKD
jgi:hypothetical protein